jgi:hypothetical protein
VIDDDLQISDPSGIAEVDRFGSDQKFSHYNSMQRWISPRSYVALQDATQERETREREGLAHEEERGELQTRGNCVLFFP